MILKFKVNPATSAIITNNGVGIGPQQKAGNFKFKIKKCKL